MSPREGHDGATETRVEGDSTTQKQPSKRVRINFATFALVETCCFSKFWKNGVREADFGGFRLFAHTIFGGETFRVGGYLEVYNSRNGIHNCFVMEENKFSTMCFVVVPPTPRAFITSQPAPPPVALPRPARSWSHGRAARAPPRSEPRRSRAGGVDRRSASSRGRRAQGGREHQDPDPRARVGGEEGDARGGVRDAQARPDPGGGAREGGRGDRGRRPRRARRRSVVRRVAVAVRSGFSADDVDASAAPPLARSVAYVLAYECLFARASRPPTRPRGGDPAASSSRAASSSSSSIASATARRIARACSRSSAASFGARSDPPLRRLCARDPAAPTRSPPRAQSPREGQS